MAENLPFEFHVTFIVKSNSLECISSALPSEFSDEEKILFINKIPLVRTNHGIYRLSGDVGEVVDKTPARYISYTLLK